MAFAIEVRKATPEEAKAELLKQFTTLAEQEDKLTEVCTQARETAEALIDLTPDDETRDVMVKADVLTTVWAGITQYSVAIHVMTPRPDQLTKPTEGA